MAEQTNQANEGLLTSLRNLTMTLVAVVHTRLELLSTDLEEGRERFISLLIVTITALFCLCFGIALLAILIVVVFWDTHRLFALGTMTGLFLTAGGLLGFFAVQAFKAMPRMFAASLGELSKDYQQLDNH